MQTFYNLGEEFALNPCIRPCYIGESQMSVLPIQWRTNWKSVGILTFMSIVNFMPSCVEYGNVL